MRTPRVVMTSGVWSLLHRGHLNVIWRAGGYGDLLVVGVVSDAGAVAYKGRAPVDSEAERMFAVGSLRCVDVVALQDTTDPTPLLRRFRPDVFCHADGYAPWSTLREQVAALGIEYVDLPYTPGISTTLLREAV